MSAIEYNKLPREILEIALKLNGSLKRIYVALYSMSEPASSNQIAEIVTKGRAYVNMRLNQLELMGLVKSKRQGKIKMFEVITCH